MASSIAHQKRKTQQARHKRAATGASKVDEDANKSTTNVGGFDDKKGIGMNVEQLSTDIMMKIFSHLDLKSLVKVSKSWAGFRIFLTSPCAADMWASAVKAHGHRGITVKDVVPASWR
ncbi:hypothetical protein T439DRAFT_247927 [Meredithblackwellia eburnea MCA 4105]